MRKMLAPKRESQVDFSTQPTLPKNEQLVVPQRRVTGLKLSSHVAVAISDDNLVDQQSEKGKKQKKKDSENQLTSSALTINDDIYKTGRILNLKKKTAGKEGVDLVAKMTLKTNL